MAARPVVRAIFSLVAAAVIFGVWNVLARYLLAGGSSPLIFTVVRSWLSVVFLGGFLCCSYCRTEYSAGGGDGGAVSGRAKAYMLDESSSWRRGRCGGGFAAVDHGRPLGHTPRVCWHCIRTVSWVNWLVLGALQMFVQLSFIYGVVLTSAQIASVFQCVGPVLTILCAALLGLEKLTAPKVAASLVAAIGVVLIATAPLPVASKGGGGASALHPTSNATLSNASSSGAGPTLSDGGQGQPPNPWGYLLLGFEALAIALGTCFQKAVLSKHKATFVILVQTTVCSCLLLVVAVVDVGAKLEPMPPWRGPDGEAEAARRWAWGLVYTVIVCTCVAYSLKAYANRTLHASQVVLSQPGQPIVTGIVAWAALGEEMQAQQWIGSVFVIVAVVLAAWASRRSGESKARGRGGAAALGAAGSVAVVAVGGRLGGAGRLGGGGRGGRGGRGGGPLAEQDDVAMCRGGDEDGRGGGEGMLELMPCPDDHEAPKTMV